MKLGPLAELLQETNKNERAMIIRARCLLPLASAPVDNGAIVIENARIKWLGRWRDCELPAGETLLDLGEAALMPGLINAHCHLDYSSMAGQIPPPKTFPDWVKTLRSFKSHWSFSEFAESWLKGARQLVDHGTTTVADTESVPELPPETWKSTPLRMISFFEMTGVKSQRSPEDLLQDACDWTERWPVDDRKQTGLSPHALYSTYPELMRKSAQLATERDLLLSTHLAESEAEHLMFGDAKGPFFDWLKGQRRMDDCGHATPIQLAQEYGLLNERLLIIHANYLVPADIEAIGTSGASVVHCPRSHEYFAHTRFRYEDLVKAGANVCLGTDSLASSRKVGAQNPELDLWGEMQLFARNYPAVSPREILHLTTLNSARALRKAGQIGALEPGAFGDLIALHYTGRVDESRIMEEVLHAPRVREVFIDGEMVRTVPDSSTGTRIS
jgi:cytosine/adenosine deaminase-related metal-dependent hydrolase